MEYNIHYLKLQNAIKQLEDTLTAVQSEDRSFKDMDITLRLHNVIKYLKEEQFVFYKARQREAGGWL